MLRKLFVAAVIISITLLIIAVVNPRLGNEIVNTVADFFTNALPAFWEFIKGVAG